MTIEELKPCPFCGASMPPHDGTSWVRCLGCGAESGWRSTDVEVIALWNTRSDTAARNAALEEAAKVAERDCDWSAFGRANIEQWDGGPDAVRDYRIGLVSARAIAAAIRAMKEPTNDD